LTEGAFARAIVRAADKIAAAPSLRKAAAIVFRSARDEEGKGAPGCGNCVTAVIPSMLQAAGYYKDAAIEPKTAGACQGGGTCGQCKPPPLKL
jgi:hypothetical protein